MIQLDLFGEVAATEHQRIVDALTCLRDAVPEALQIVVELDHHQARDSRSPRASGDWAYCVSADGLRFERADDWWNTARHRGETWGWSRTPAHLLPWADLTALIGHDQRRADLAAWMSTLPHPCWQILHRPKELWPDPDSWHPSHIHRDHTDPHWPARRRAWQLVLDLLDDALDAIPPSTTDQHPDDDIPLSHTARDVTDADALSLMLTTGVHTKPLTDLERTHAVRALIDDENVSTAEVAVRCGVTPSTIRRWYNGDTSFQAPDEPNRGTPLQHRPRTARPRTIGVRRLNDLADRWADRCKRGLSSEHAQALLVEIRALTSGAR